jgi:hypothetical protein
MLLLLSVMEPDADGLAREIWHEFSGGRLYRNRALQKGKPGREI